MYRLLLTITTLAVVAAAGPAISANRANAVGALATSNGEQSKGLLHIAAWAPGVAACRDFAKQHRCRAAWSNNANGCACVSPPR